MRIVDLLKNSYTLTLVQYAANPPPFDELAALCAASAAFSDECRFTQRGVGDDPWVPFDGTAGELAAGMPLDLVTAGRDPITLTFHRDPFCRPAEDIVRIFVPIGTPWATPERLWSYLRDVAVGYNASVAWLTTYDLFGIASESLQRALLAEDDLSLELFGEPPQRWTGSIAFKLPPALVERFAALADPRTIDRLAVPQTVWWANYWSAEVVERVGRARIDAVRWRHREPAGDGLLLVPVEDPPDRDHVAAIEAVADAIEALDLPALQRAGA